MNKELKKVIVKDIEDSIHRDKLVIKIYELDLLGHKYLRIAKLVNKAAKNIGMKFAITELAVKQAIRTTDMEVYMTDAYNQVIYNGIDSLQRDIDVR